jgi:hypothetical protein
MRPNIAIPAFVIFILAVTAIVYFFLTPMTGPNLEVLKSLLQLSVVGLAALGVSGVVAISAERDLARKETNNLIRRAVEDLNGAYNGAKRIRRKIRSTIGRDARASLKAESYGSMMEELSDIELRLELVAKYLGEIRFHVGDLGAASASIKAMYGYLKQLVSEWEVAMPNARTNELELGGLVRLRDMIGDYRCSRFRAEFAKQYDNAIAALVGRLTAE